MAENDCASILYKTPTTEIIGHRKEFYNLWKRCDNQTATWFNQVQSQIDRCEFPSVMSREYLLIDKFVCELDDNERKFIQCVNDWTFNRLKKFLKNLKAKMSHQANGNVPGNKSVNCNSKIPLTTTTSSSSSSLLVAVRCEPVSKTQNLNYFKL